MTPGIYAQCWFTPIKMHGGSLIQGLLHSEAKGGLNTGRNAGENKAPRSRIMAPTDDDQIQSLIRESPERRKSSVLSKLLCTSCLSRQWIFYPYLDDINIVMGGNRCAPAMETQRWEEPTCVQRSSYHFAERCVIYFREWGYRLSGETSNDDNWRGDYHRLVIQIKSWFKKKKILIMKCYPRL